MTFLATLVFVCGSLYVISLFSKESFLEKISNPRWIILILVVTFGSSGGVYARIKSDADKKQHHRVINDRDIQS